MTFKNKFCLPEKKNEQEEHLKDLGKHKGYKIFNIIEIGERKNYSCFSNVFALLQKKRMDRKKLNYPYYF